MDSSSNSRTLGSVTRALEMANICCSPPDRVPAICLRRSLRRGKVAKVRSSTSLAVSPPR